MPVVYVYVMELPTTLPASTTEQKHTQQTI